MGSCVKLACKQLPMSVFTSDSGFERRQAIDKKGNFLYTNRGLDLYKFIIG